MERRKDNKNRVLKEGEYQRANGTYEYRWTDVLGQRHSIYAKKLDKLRMKEKEITKNDFIGIRSDNPNLKINDLFERWKEIKRGVKSNTFSNYVYIYNRFVKNDLGQIKVKKIKSSDVRAFYISLHEKNDVKIGSLKCVQSVLHQVFDLAVEDQYILKNPSDHALRELKKIYGENSEKRALTKSEQKIFEDFLKNDEDSYRWYPIFTVMLWTGMRVGEITGLRWCDLDFENNLINVNHTLVYYNNHEKNRMCFSINTPKTKNSIRNIPMIEKVKQAFIEEKRLQKEAKLESTAIIDGYKDFVFINVHGAPHLYVALNSVLTRIIRDCNTKIIDSDPYNEDPELIPKISNHTLRHTFATRMCEYGVNIKVIQEILGHSDIGTTLNIYAEATEDFTSKEIEKFSENFNF